MRQNASLGCSIAAIGLIAVVVITGIGLWFGFAQRWFFDLNREAVQHSQQYVEAKNSLLLDLIQQSEDPAATAGQKAASVDRFCHEVTLLEDSEEATPVARFEAENC